MFNKKLTILIAGFLLAPHVMAASCSLSDKDGFHVSGENLCLGEVDYVDGMAKNRQLDINSFKIINDDMVVYTAKSPLGSFLMLGTSKGNVKIFGDMPSNEVEKNISMISNVNVYMNDLDIYFLSDAWVTSGAIHRIKWQQLLDVLDNSPITIDDIEYITNGNSLYVIQRGKYQGYIITEKHKYKDGGGSYDAYYLISPDGTEIKKIGIYKEQVNDFLYESGTKEFIK
ncbi:hypothetical protein ACMGDI_03450 [Morganella morganii]|uniref:hypothetical protein n=1 Tax=Morganella morganii TaxID=582 RepID=UPI0034D79410